LFPDTNSDNLIGSLLYLDSFDNLKYTADSMTMTNKKWAVKRITVNLATQEAEKLEKYCQQTGRPATDVIRELIRSLPVSDDSKDGNK
jgi:hypothetical protein